VIGAARRAFVTILGMVISLVGRVAGVPGRARGHFFNGPVYTWITSGGVHFESASDRPASALMMLVVTSSR
jgi:NADH-quinone oxidoreductase subunit L